MSNFNFLNDLRKLKNPVEKMEFVRREDYRKQAIIANLKAMNEMIASRYAVYDKTTKADINFLADRYKAIFRDYRSAMIKDSKKADLSNTLINVNNRMIQEAESFYVELDYTIAKIRQELHDYLKQQKGRKLLEKIYPQKNDYIQSFETASEGVRAWECLSAIVEDGTVGLKELPEYGIDVEGIVLD